MGRMCTPDCPYFRCLKKSLAFVTPRGKILTPRAKERYKGKVTAWCLWANDVCKGYQCQYANCVKHAMLPNGTCTLGIKVKEVGRSIEEEAKALEKEYLALKPKLKKLRIEDIDL